MPTQQNRPKWISNNTTEMKGGILIAVTVAQLPFFENNLQKNLDTVRIPSHGK